MAWKKNVVIVGSFVFSEIVVYVVVVSVCMIPDRSHLGSYIIYYLSFLLKVRVVGYCCTNTQKTTRIPSRMIRKELRTAIGLLSIYSLSSLSFPSSAAIRNMASSNKNYLSGLCDFDCNLLHKDIIGDKDRFITAARKLGITYLIVPGSTLEESQSILSLTHDEVWLIATAGEFPSVCIHD